jgi:hypothetical protein
VVRGVVQVALRNMRMVTGFFVVARFTDQPRLHRFAAKEATELLTEFTAVRVLRGRTRD